MLSNEMCCVSLHPKGDFSMSSNKVYEMQHDPFTIHPLEYHLEIHLLYGATTASTEKSSRSKGRKVDYLKFKGLWEVVMNFVGVLLPPVEGRCMMLFLASFAALQKQIRTLYFLHLLK